MRFSAEWILSLVIAPGRAAAAIGDLQEERSERGRLWFWWSVLGTAASHLWQDLRLHPGWAIGRAFWALGTTIVYTFLFGFPLFMWLPRVHYYEPGVAVSAPSPWAAPLLIGAMCSLVPFVVGGQNARQPPQRELASATAGIVMRVSFCLLSLCLSALQMRKIGHPFPTEDPRIIVAASFSMLLGAALQRRRAARQTSGITHA